MRFYCIVKCVRVNECWEVRYPSTKCVKGMCTEKQDVPHRHGVPCDKVSVVDSVIEEFCFLCILHES